MIKIIIAFWLDVNNYIMASLMRIILTFFYVNNNGILDENNNGILDEKILAFWMKIQYKVAFFM